MHDVDDEIRTTVEMLYDSNLCATTYFGCIIEGAFNRLCPVNKSFKIVKYLTRSFANAYSLKQDL